jgi:transcription elongation factor GreA
MVRKEVFLTEEGRQNLEEELDHLVSVRRREVATRLHKASETGGTVDNAEYDEAKNEQAFLEGRISDLDNILSNAVVAPIEKGDGGVRLGSKVTVTSEDGSKRNYTVVGSAEAAPLDGKISLESPVGMALMEHEVGDEVEVETPAGSVKLKITKIR